MTQPSAGPAPVYQDEDEISLFAVASVLLRYLRGSLSSRIAA